MAKCSYHREIIALSDGTTKLMKIRNYLTDLGFILACTDVREDNHAVIRYARDIGMARAARSLAQHFHSGRSLKQEGIINIIPVASADNRADFFTKLQPKDQFRASIHRLGLKPVADCRAAYNT